MRAGRQARGAATAPHPRSVVFFSAACRPPGGRRRRRRRGGAEERDRDATGSLGLKARCPDTWSHGPLSGNLQEGGKN